ncbi:MAG: hypothetical protein ACKPKO_54320, partial [Candidatus Fonsibacter sp.]
PSLVIPQCILEGLVPHVANSMRRTRASILPSIRQQTSQLMPKTTTHTLFSSAEIHGWSSLLGATPLSFILCYCCIAQRAEKVISRRHWRFLLSQQHPMHCHAGGQS